MVWLKISLTEQITLDNLSFSTLSILLNTTAQFFTLSSCKIDKCSSVCGIGPSSAAITNNPKSILEYPASILFINFLCPGTSIKFRISPFPRSRYAKPRSIDIPLTFSSGNRSEFIPVIASTNLVLP